MATAHMSRPVAPSRVVLVVCLGTSIAPAGIQGIAPAIPAIQAQFGLTVAQVALITSVYLLPSIFSAFGAGVLADKIGARAVFAAALAIFGLGGVALILDHSLSTLMIARVVQGAAFGAILSVSVSIIGMVAPSGPTAARGQSRRVISLELGQAVLPVLAGLLVGSAWYAPFFLHLLALPAALLVWWLLPDGLRHSHRGRKAPVRAVVGAPALVGVQVLGSLRFFFKFAVVTYFPVLAVGTLGLSPGAVGLIVGGQSLAAALAAWGTERVVGRWLSSQVIACCLMVYALCLVTLGSVGLLAGRPSDMVVVVVFAILVFGVPDGVYAVAHNVLITEMAPVGALSTYVGLTGTTRNIGKFVAPLAFGAMTLVLSVAQGFVVLGGVSALAVGVARRVTGVQRRTPVPRPSGVPTDEDP